MLSQLGSIKGFVRKNYTEILILLIIIVSVIIFSIIYKNTFGKNNQNEEGFLSKTEQTQTKNPIFTNSNKCPGDIKIKKKVPITIPRVPPPPKCVTENSLLGNIQADPNSGVEVFYYSYDKDVNFYKNSNQTATYYGRQIKKTMPEMWMNDTVTLARYSNFFPLAIMTRSMNNYDGSVRDAHIDIVSPEGFAIKMEDTYMLTSWITGTNGAMNTSLCYRIGEGIKIYTQMFWHLSKNPATPLSIQLRDKSGSASFKPSILKTRVAKNLPVARWDFYTGDFNDRNGILSTDYHKAEGQMKMGTFQGKKCLVFNGDNGWVKTQNAIAGAAFRSFTCMFYYGGLANTNECNGRVSNRIFALSNGSDLYGDYQTNNDSNISIEGGIIDNGYAFIRLKSPEQSNSLMVKSKLTVPVNTWTHIAAVFSDDFKTAKLYINGSLAGQGSNLAINKNYYSGFKFSYGAMGHAPGLFRADKSANPFLGGMAWQHWFDYSMCESDIKQDYQLQMCDTSAYSEPDNTGWLTPCTQRYVKKLDLVCYPSGEVNRPDPESPNQPPGSPKCPDVPEGNAPACNDICINSGQFNLTSAPNDSGNTYNWSSVASSLDGSIVLACCFGNSVYILNKQKSKDWVEVNWFNAEDNLSTSNWTSVACNSSGAVMVACVQGGSVYISKNSGDVWSQMTNGIPVAKNWECVTCSRDGSIIVAVGDEDIYLSKNMGASWQLKGPADPKTSFYNVGSSADGKKHIALCYNETSADVTNKIMYSTDSAETWQESDGIPGTPSLSNVILSEDGSYAYISINGKGVYVSRDGGKSWSTEGIELPSIDSITGQLTTIKNVSINIPDGNWQWITGSYDLKTMMICSMPITLDSGLTFAGEIYSSLNYGRTWIATNAQNLSWQNLTVSGNGKFVYACDGNGGIWSSKCCDPAAWWSNSLTVNNASWASVSISDIGTAIACAGGGKLYSGSSVNLTEMSNNVIPKGLDWNHVIISKDGQIMIAQAWEGPCFISTNEGIVWSKLMVPNRKWSSGAISSDNSTIVLVDYAGGIYVGNNKNNNISWSKSSISPQPWHSVAVSANGSVMVAVASNGFGIVVSTDSGRSWKTTCAQINMWEGVAISDDGKKMVAVQYGGYIFMSSNTGATWKRVGEKDAGKHSWIGVCASSNLCRIYAVGDNCNIYMSFDYGQTWTPGSAPKFTTQLITSWRAISCTSDGTSAIAVNSLGDIWTTNTFKTCSFPPNSLQTAFSGSNSGCEDGIATVSCSNGQVLSGINVTYGRWQKNVCGDSWEGNEPITVNKTLEPSECLDKPSCSYKISTENFGINPVKDTKKQWSANPVCTEAN
jgi:photosystem II stability/assembly factor-like uncharacterized protein